MREVVEESGHRAQEARPSLETSHAAWFAERAMPEDLSAGRALPGQIARMFAH